MKKTIILGLALLFLAGLGFAENVKYGTLNVHSEISGVEIYVDGELKGRDFVRISEIQAGSHLIKAIKGDKVIYSEVAQVPEGNFITVVIKEKEGEIKVEEVEAPKEPKREEPKEVKKETPLPKKSEPGFTLSFGSHNQKLSVHSSTIEATGTGSNLEMRWALPSWYGLSFYSAIDYANTSYSIFGVDMTGHLVSAGSGVFYRLTIYDDLRLILNGGVNYSYVTNAGTSGAAFTANGSAMGYEYGAGLEFGNFILAAEYSITSPDITIDGAGASFSAGVFDFRTTAVRLGWLF